MGDLKFLSRNFESLRAQQRKVNRTDTSLTKMKTTEDKQGQVPNINHMADT